MDSSNKTLTELERYQLQAVLARMETAQVRLAMVEAEKNGLLRVIFEAHGMDPQTAAIDPNTGQFIDKHGHDQPAGL